MIFGIHYQPMIKKRKEEYLHIKIWTVFIIHSNTHAKHTHIKPHTEITHCSFTRLEISKQDTDSQPNLFLRKEKKTLLLQAALLQNCSLMPQGLCTISSLHTDQRVVFYHILFFIATTSNITYIDRLTLDHCI